MYFIVLEKGAQKQRFSGIFLCVALDRWVMRAK
jgi:hypothetical protein